jgi:outer membrane lipoprotein-sorting protein
MKKLLAFAFLLLLIAFQTKAQTADEIVAKHIEARGGAEKLKNLQTMVMEGSVEQGGNQISLKFYLSNGKGVRTEFSVMGQTGYNILTPVAGWSFNPFAGNTEAEAMPEDQVKEGQSQLDIAGPLFDYKAKGNKVELLGKEKIEAGECFKLLLTRPNGKTATYFINESWLMVRAISTSTVNGSEVEVTTDYTDYRKTQDGYTIAFKRINANGEISFDKIETNVKIEESLFKPGN